MAKQYAVRCKPSSSGTFKTTLWDSSISPPVQVTASEIVIVSRTDFELRADYANSDASISGFTLKIAPTANDIDKVVGNQTPVISFLDKCSSGGAIDLNVEVLALGGPYPMGPKPIIRNRPTTPPPTFDKKWMFGLLILIALLLVWYFFRQ